MLYYSLSDINKVIERDNFKIRLINTIKELEADLRIDIKLSIMLLESKNKGVIEPYNSYLKGLYKSTYINIPLKESINTHIEYYKDLKESFDNLNNLKIELINL